MKTVESILETSARDFNQSFIPDFIQIINNKCMGYYGRPKDKLKAFFEDMQHGGCVSGMIGEFIYNSDNKEFYINHIDDLEDYKQDIEEDMGESIKNRHNLPHYTFVVWLCFEEFCYSIYSSIFEQ